MVGTWGDAGRGSSSSSGGGGGSRSVRTPAGEGVVPEKLDRTSCGDESDQHSQPDHIRGR